MAILPLGNTPDHAYVLAALQTLKRAGVSAMPDAIVRPAGASADDADTERSLRRAAESTHDTVIISKQGMEMLRALQAAEAAQGF